MTDLSERRIRTDGDSWDITESVGATALGVAAIPNADELARLGRPATEDLVEEAMDSVFVHARLEGDAR